MITGPLRAVPSSCQTRRVEGLPSSDGSRRKRKREDSRRAIIQAGLGVLEEGGFDALTMAAVAGRAEVSVGSVYNRFADKDKLVVALHVAFVSSLVSEGTQAAPEVTGSLAEVLHELVAEHCRLMSSHESLMRVFMHLTATNVEIKSRAAQSTRAIGRQFTGRLLAHPHSEIQHPDPAMAADVCFEMVHDVIARRVARGGTFESDVELSWGRLGEELTHVCVAYLRAPAR